jgi:hypothetical protein
VSGVRQAVEGAVTRRRERRNLSAEARKRIGDAQRKRWAEWKANQQGSGPYPASQDFKQPRIKSASKKKR